VTIKFTKSKKVVILCSAVWILLILVISLGLADHPVSQRRSHYSGGFDFVEFISIFMLVGIVPVLLVWGVMWIRSTPAKVGGIEDFLAGIPLAPDIRCPRCNALMKLKTTKSGPNAGKVFWGCSRFPTCIQIAPLSAGTTTGGA
jgi:hypothetical protein